MRVAAVPDGNAPRERDRNGRARPGHHRHRDRAGLLSDKSGKPHVLLVEDYDDARVVCADLLETQGYRVTTAVNGVEAVEKARDERPDVVLMDLSLPLMDGVNAIRMLKESGETRDIPVALLTGHVAGQRSRDAAASGCDMVIAKPCLPDDLEARLRSLLAKKK